jgi:hypothetical protein
MNGNELLNSLPINYTTDQNYNKIILDIVANNIAYCEWYPISSTYKDHTGTFTQLIINVCDDAFRFDLDDKSRFRFPVSAQLTQMCADVLNKSMLTAKISDLTFLQSELKLNYICESSGPEMMTIPQSVKYNNSLEKARAGQDNVLLSDRGKSWVIDNRLVKPNSAINHGFYNLSGRIIQNRGTMHSMYHSDYSQTLQLMDSECKINGELVKVVDIMDDPVLAYLVNYEGRLKYKRQPGIHD